MTKFEHYLSGKIFGIKYIFDTVKDGLPGHIHQADTLHNICVLRGEVQLLFTDQTVYLEEGDIYDFDGSRFHSIRAMKPNSCILNLFLNGQPEEYKTLPKHELAGEFLI